MKYAVKEARVVLKEGNTLYCQEPLSNPELIAGTIGNEIRNLDREEMVVVNMTAKNHAISYHVVSIGDVSACAFSIANIFKTAIIQNAAAIVLMHNHPSGDLIPSREDIATTKRIKKAGEIIGVTLLDHIIVGPGRFDYLSMLDSGYMDE